MSSVVMDGLTFSADELASASNPLGHSEILPATTGTVGTYLQEPRFPDRIFGAMINELNTQVGTAQNAAAAALANSFSTTSDSSIAIGTGSKEFDTAEALDFVPGLWVQISERTDPTTNYMVGQITSWSAGSPNRLTVNVTLTVGSGTISDWTITLAGAPGAEAGLSDVVKTNAGDPNGTVAADAVGQFCIDTTNKKLYYATLAGGPPGSPTSTWQLLQPPGPLAIELAQADSPYTFTKANYPNHTLAFVQLWAAGGAGGDAAGGGGGGGGAYNCGWFLLSELGATETVTIGAGGGINTNSTGDDGGNSSFGNWLFAEGGKGGGAAGGRGGGTLVTTSGGSPGQGPAMYLSGSIAGYGAFSGSQAPSGTGAPGIPNANGGPSGGNGDSGTGTGGAGGDSVNSGASGGGGVDSGTAGQGGFSQRGGNGGDGASGANDAGDGTIPGGGGGGAGSGNANKAGAGADGKVIITLF